MTLYPESFVKDRLYIKFSNVKKAEWNVTIKRETYKERKYFLTCCSNSKTERLQK
jgi:hypothetical protein